MTYVYERTWWVLVCVQWMCRFSFSRMIVVVCKRSVSFSPLLLAFAFILFISFYFIIITFIHCRPLSPSPSVTMLAFARICLLSFNNTQIKSNNERNRTPGDCTCYLVCKYNIWSSFAFRLFSLLTLSSLALNITRVIFSPVFQIAHVISYILSGHSHTQKS